MHTLNCNGKLIELNEPKVMGIVNVTPDSFYDGGKTVTKREILAQAERMLSEGATFLDIGGYSSRPGASAISETEETERVLPAIEAIAKEFPNAILSIDTFRSKVAKQAIAAGAAMVNDISGGSLDPYMLDAVASLQVPYCMMHMRGTPQTMSSQTNYTNLTKEILHYFSEKIANAKQKGINDLLVDPGFGFAKTRQQNFELLSELELFSSLETPVLIGISRKSMIYKTLDTTVENALNGTTALHAIALFKGASILRVHDVKPAIECVTLLKNLPS
ncbi:MAG: dihydropteroate synthase [Flavobacteriales bacterium]|uniref:dihydropteroate synthase n=1 Tax=Candidatus Ulvibacter alkanivorans TaxID=2267620 RepID=UPI001FE5EC34|nr:dihydropteroate synthase [Candidatus Ulvibacter alkanivorans]MCH2489580.1 dihydropteroate synthase [Flavobacteriales bacterium]